MNPDIKTAIVFDTAAESSGALSVLKGFYQAAREDKSVNWIFVISKPNLEESDNVKVLNFPETKKSWLHRLYFDWFVAPKLAKIYKADCIFSLQNICVRSDSIPQLLFIHQSIPFCDKKFSLFKTPKLWIYQNVISRLIFFSAKKADRIAVQTAWMKNALLSKISCFPEKIAIIPPEIKLNEGKKFKNSPSAFKSFFYPAMPLSYKNHEAILHAVKILKSAGYTDFSLYFTIPPDSKTAKKFSAEKININALGMISAGEMCKFYSETVTIFPSYLESFGYPLMEARIAEAPIIASDTSFSHEILDGYENAKFFKFDNPQELANLMKECICGNFGYRPPKNEFSLVKGGWKNIINLIKDLQKKQ